MLIHAYSLFSIFSGIFSFFSNNFSTVFFYYYIVLFIALALSLALNARKILDYFKNVKVGYYKYLLITVLVFILLEVTFVQNYHFMYNDEYIYMSMAKSMLIDPLFRYIMISSTDRSVKVSIGMSGIVVLE